MAGSTAEFLPSIIESAKLPCTLPGLRSLFPAGRRFARQTGLLILVTLAVLPCPNSCALLVVANAVAVARSRAPPGCARACF